MAILETVVVGVDGSAPSIAAVGWAAAHVDFGGSLHLVNAGGSDGGSDRGTGPDADCGPGGDLDPEWIGPALSSGRTTVTHRL
ncbi:MAG: hypothetical protein ACR2QK_22000, partial [Acidimicrobiales bacterium]